MNFVIDKLSWENDWKYRNKEHLYIAHLIKLTEETLYCDVVSSYVFIIMK